MRNYIRDNKKARLISPKEMHEIMEEFIMIDHPMQFIEWLQSSGFEIVKVIDE